MSRYQIYDSIDAVDPADWSRVCGGRDGLFFEPDFIRTVETTMADVCRLWHVVFFDRGEAVAVASLCTFRVDLDVLGGAGAKRLAGAVRRLSSRWIKPTVLLCGLPVSLGQSSLLLAADADPASVVPALDRVMREVARRERASFLVFKELTAGECAPLGALDGLGYRRAPSLPMLHFRRRFADFDDYCSHLKSHYRQDIRRSRRKLERCGVRTVRLRSADAIRDFYTADTHRLYDAVFAGADNRFEHLPIDFFHDLAGRYDGRISLTALVHGDRTVAFNWALTAGSVYYFLFCGIDYQLNREADLYFNVMYADLDHGLREDVASIQLGQTSEQFKARLGGEPEPLYLYVRGRGRLTSALVRLLSGWIFPERDPVPSFDIYRQHDGAGPGDPSAQPAPV